MSNQLRYNEGKPRLSYWYSTALSLVGQVVVADSEHARSAAACMLSVASFLNGQISAMELIRAVFDEARDLKVDIPVAYSEVCVFGESKYARGNFRKGQSVCHYADSALRHLRALTQGQDLDEDSGKSHWGHVWWNLAQIYEIMYNPKVAVVRDDRLFHHGDLSGT